MSRLQRAFFNWLCIIHVAALTFIVIVTVAATRFVTSSPIVVRVCTVFMEVLQAAEGYRDVPQLTAPAFPCVWPTCAR